MVDLRGRPSCLQLPRGEGSVRHTAPSHTHRDPTQQPIESVQGGMTPAPTTAEQPPPISVRGTRLTLPAQPQALRIQLAHHGSAWSRSPRSQLPTTRHQSAYRGCSNFRTRAPPPGWSYAPRTSPISRPAPPREGPIPVPTPAGRKEFGQTDGTPYPAGGSRGGPF
jgi:hypothetical protein